MYSSESTLYMTPLLYIGFYDIIICIPDFMSRPKHDELSIVSLKKLFNFGWFSCRGRLVQGDEIRYINIESKERQKLCFPMKTPSCSNWLLSECDFFRIYVVTINYMKHIIFFYKNTNKLIRKLNNYV